ncbi:glycosyltransferase family protein [Maribellus sediminis]|uniref:glycosyltransferase family protein n=1 Tax=Maribellus sediminis TaxID=2696285 RepID=UPI001430E7D4|nr:glycosyltransferase family protein [Maribellus sediminis]
MKILYAIQGTGNGHLARATEIIPYLQELGETDLLVSGIQGDIRLPFEVKYKLYGFSFIFGRKGGVDIWQTILKFRPFRLLRDILNLPVRDYDVVLCDFEPVAAWACKLRKVKCVGVSHQNAVLHPKAPKPAKSELFGRLILKHYAPTATNYGFHFKALDALNFTPVIRSSIRQAVPAQKGHITVYLPAFSDRQIEKLLINFNQIRWEVFSKNTREEYTRGSIYFSPVSMKNFNRSFVNCSGILCSAGFETPAEALFMGKKLCVVPMKNQYEQACNAAFLAELGIPVIKHISDFQEKLQMWLSDQEVVQIAYPDQTREIIHVVVNRYQN